MKIGVFGGTFDPPHLGHLIFAEEALFQLNLTTVLWVPASNPPHKPKKNISDVQIRLELVRCAIQDNSHFEMSLVDVDRLPPHYAVDTMKVLHKLKPEDELIYLLGGDSAADIHKWYQPTNFLKLCDGLGVMHRLGDEADFENLEQLVPGISKKITILETPIIEISGSQIRMKIRRGVSYRYYLPENVFKLIEEKMLYR